MAVMNQLMMTAAGAGSSCPALEGTMWAWGDGNGFLGHDNLTDYSVPTQIGSLTNWTNNVGSWTYGEGIHIIKSDGTLWGFGYSNFGQIGDGDTTHRSSPVQVGSDTDWAQVSNGSNWTAAIKTNGTLYTWGYNGYGQLGHGNTTNLSVPTQVGSLTTYASVRCADAYYTMFLKTDGTLWGMGVNRQGNLGNGSTAADGVSSPVQAGSATNWLAFELTGRTVGGAVLALASA